MKDARKYFLIGCAWGLSACLLLLSASRAESYLLKDEKRGTSVSIFGLGMVRLNHATVNGDAVEFEESDDGYADGFDTSQFASFTANGTLFHDYAVDGFLRYDDEDDPDLSFLLKFMRDESYLAVGDQMGMFTENYFTRYANPFRGATLHLESDTLGVTTFAAVARGSVEKEELTPNGTSGPYLLAHLPVVSGSERITIEVRNRNDDKQTIERRPQERNADYTIDYDTGEITFAEPVDRETFHGDPVVIVAIYRSEEDANGFDSASGGGRVSVSPTDWAGIGATYVTEFSSKTSFSDGFDARQQIYSVDGALRLTDALKLTTEYAVSQDMQNAQNDPHQAWRATLAGKFGERVDLSGWYHRTERDFATFANPDVDPDQQELELIGKYAFWRGHSLELGYSFFEDNLPQDASEPTTTTHRRHVGWEADIGERTTLFSKYEYIKNTDDRQPKTTDDYSHIFLMGGTHEFLSVPALKTLELRAEYGREDFEDDTDEEADTMTHRAGLRAQAEPFKKVVAYAEQKERLIHEKDLDEDTERQDISEIGLELARWQRFALRTKYQYRAKQNLLEDRLISKRHTAIVGADYQPFDALKTFAKVEFYDETYRESASEAETTDESGDNSTQGLTIHARATYTPLKDLTCSADYEYQDDRDRGENRTMEDEAEFRVNYAFDRRRTRLTGSVLIERDLLDAPPTPEAKTRTTTLFAGAVRQLTDKWDVLGQYKRETVTIDADNARDDILGEVGWSFSRFFKASLGYQYTEFRDRVESETDYEAHSVYLRLIGKL